jgi:Flp pilus assembly protein TadB
MISDLMLTVLKDYGISGVALLALGWAYWQERRQNEKNREEDKVDDKTMITALVEVKNALQQFQKIIEDYFHRR